MRGKKAAVNTIMSFVEDIVGIICSFILPRLILSVYGSKYNGLTNSISQFLSCAVLLRSGIGGATRAALYKPIAQNDKHKIDAIVKATNIYMKKIGCILAVMIVIFAAIYPFLVQDEFGWVFTFSLFIIIGTSTFADSFFGITYLIVLQANQQLWISSLMKCLCSILNTIIAVVLILCGSPIHIVKLGSAFVYVMYPIVLGIYVKHRYKINSNVKPDNHAISQRWDSFWHQVAVFVMNNTDIMVLTVYTNMLEISVYSVYNMVLNGLKRFISSFSNSFEPAFGNMIAKNESIALKNNLSATEMFIYNISTIIHTCAALLVISFVSIYTKGIKDVNYSRPLFAYIIILANFFNSIRLPYQTVVQAAGHYKQTKAGAILEPIINLSLSVILVIRLGMLGVAIGTLFAIVFRTVQYSTYMSKNIIIRNPFIPLLRCLVSCIEFVIISFIVYKLDLDTPVTYLSWFVNAVIVGIISLLVVLACSFIFYRKDTIYFTKRLNNIIIKKL